MAEATQIIFKFAELAEMLVKKENLHEGHWGIIIKFGISAANLSLNGAEHRPTAIVPVMEIGIQRENEPTPLSVDAAIVNPAPNQTTAKPKLQESSTPVKKKLTKK
jgi:hypothetical protein